MQTVISFFCMLGTILRNDKHFSSRCYRPCAINVYPANGEGFKPLELPMSLLGRLSSDGRTAWRNMSLRGTSSTGGRSTVTRQSPRQAAPSVQTSSKYTSPLSSSSVGQGTLASQSASTPRRSGQAPWVDRGRSQLPKKSSQSQREWFFCHSLLCFVFLLLFYFFVN